MVMGENYSVDRPNDHHPLQLKPVSFLQLYFPYVRASAALSMLYPSVTQISNIPNSFFLISATHARLVHSDLDSRVFSEAVGKTLQRHPSSKRTLWPLCITERLKVRG